MVHANSDHMVPLTQWRSKECSCGLCQASMKRKKKKRNSIVDQVNFFFLLNMAAD